VATLPRVFEALLARFEAAAPARRRFRFKNKLVSLDSTMIELIAMPLLRYLQLRARFAWSLSNLVALLRMNLFTYRDV
jgi:hypothetical protein